MSTAPIAVVGHVCVDVRATPTTSFPERGRLVECDTVEPAIGGAIGNMGRVFGHLGQPVVSVCRVGADTWGDMIVRDLSTWSDTRFVTRSTTASTSGTIVFVAPDGERSFIHARGTNAEFASEHVPLADLVRLGVAHLHVAYALLLPALDGAPMAALLREAGQLGMTTSLDMTWDSTGQWMQAIGPLLPHVDYFCPNDSEAGALTGESDPVAAARSLVAHGVRRMAVVTCGSAGAVAAMSDGRVIDVEPVPIETANVTGAGDCFNAGLLAALATGDDERSALHAAAKAAASAIAN